jgi:apolipoprotein N-acyltransferase
MTNGRRALTACAAGATLALGAPPLQWWPTTFLAAALFALSIDGASVRRAALSGWLMGTVATLGAFYWIVGTVSRFTDLPFAAAVLAYLLMAMVAGLTHAVAGALAGAAGPVLGYPLALGLGMFVAERYVPGIFPWQFAAPLIYAPWVRQAADVVGLSGLSALLPGTMMVLVRALQAWRGRRGGEQVPRGLRGQLVFACGLLALMWGYGALRTGAVTRAMAAAPQVRVALVQPAIPPTVRWDELAHGEILAQLQRQTQAALGAGAGLVVWSEAAYPYVLPHQRSREGEWSAPIYPAPAQAPLLVGALTQDPEGRRYNAALLREPDGTLSAPVAKRVLVPFGEYIPVVNEIEWVRRSFARADGLSRGTAPSLLRTSSGLQLAVLNCFEDTIARLGAEMAGADLLVNITNDAWFGDGAAPWQHLMLAQWRAIETRRELVRAVNTGVTTRVDALGRIAEHAPLWQPAVLVVEAHRMQLHPLAPFTIQYAPPVAVVVLAGAALERLRRRRANR